MVERLVFRCIYKLLKSANNVSSEDERSEKVWDEFFFKSFAPPETRTSLEPVPSNIIGLDSKKMITAKSKKKEFLKKVEDGKITEEEGIKLLGKEFSKDEKENIYRNYKKNIFIFLDHNFLWDKFQYVTPLGKKLVERVGKYEGDIKKLNDEFAQIILVQGKHQEFIEEYKKLVMNLKQLITKIFYREIRNRARKTWSYCQKSKPYKR